MPLLTLVCTEIFLIHETGDSDCCRRSVESSDCFSLRRHSLFPPLLDDFHSFVHERSVYITDWTVSSLVLLSKTFFGWTRWLPMISFSIDHWLGKGDIAYFHLTNLLIHLLCFFSLIFLVFNLLRAVEEEDSCPWHAHITACDFRWGTCGRSTRFKPMPYLSGAANGVDAGPFLYCFIGVLCVWAKKAH